MSAYYNEHDPFAAAWLAELMADGLIAPGDIDQRSIEDVAPKDLDGYAQCHFFAGIGIWSLALRLAGWPDDAPVWTGSCPCQPFSAAGKGAGFVDERHLWPAFCHLIRIRRPAIVFGEQVASPDGLAWLDLVQTDLEDADYACGALDTCAAGFGAPHIRQRLYWVANACSAGLEGRDGRALGDKRAAPERSGGARRLARPDQGQCGRLADGEGCERDRQAPGRIEGDGIAQSCGEHGGVADITREGRRSTGCAEARACAGAPGERTAQSGGHGGDHRPGPLNGLWRDGDWLYCRDGKWRPVSAGSFPLADARTIRNRVGKLRGSGNALNVAQAAEFIKAAKDAIEEQAA